MRISEAKQIIKELYLNTDLVTALVSERGIGKTSAYQQCAKELGIGYQALYAAALEGPDFMGLPDKNSKDGITRYLAPQFLPTRAAVESGVFPSEGLLVFEEINRVPSDTVSVLYPLLLERRINQHELAPGWKIGVTMNPETLNYSVNSLDDALIDRFVTLEIGADLDDYLAYSQTTGACEIVLDYLKHSPDMLLVVRESAESDPLDKSPTPRGWTRVQQVLNQCTLDTDREQLLVAGIIGPRAAASFYGFRQNMSLPLPSAVQVLEDYFLYDTEIKAILDANRFDLLNLLFRRLAVAINFDEKHYRNLDHFLDLLPEETLILFFKTLALQRPEEFSEIADNLSVYEKAADTLVDFIAAG